MTQNRQRGPRPPAPPAPESVQEAPQGAVQSPPGPSPTDPTADPLAELRDPQETGLPAIAGEEPDLDDEELEETGIPLVTQDRQDQARAQIVAAWHADPTSIGFLHKGRGCGCSFIAGLALQTVMPVVLEDEPDTANLTDPEE